MRLSLIFLLGLTIAGVVYAWTTRSTTIDQIYNAQAFKHEFVIVQANHLMGFNLVDPEQAPPEILDSVMRGCNIFMHTDFYASEYAKNELSCTNCHFLGGDTLGGKNGGISLVGVTTLYPQFSSRAGRVITLPERIHNCFQRSMNGIAPPADSEVMKDLITYLTWISKEVENVKNIPWLGLPMIQNDHKPDAVAGKQVYEDCCAACHNSSGEGGGHLTEEQGKTIPPLWGPNSFNDGAGMNTIKMLAPFVYLNMPYKQAHLTEEEALDVAAYITSQPRPHFTK